MLTNQEQKIKAFYQDPMCAMRKQNPETVKYDIDVDERGNFIHPVAHCPRCDYTFYQKEHTWGCNYCHSCGQRLNWGKDDD